MKNTIQAQGVQPLRFLPRDRKTLDFILNKLATNSSPERFDLLQELFEMHRTSVGFDPTVLSKGRFKRFKSFELKKVLAELENDLVKILSSDEYTLTVENGIPYKELFDQYITTASMLSAPPSKELNDQVDKFCNLLLHEGAYELLLSFYRHAYQHFSQRNVNIDKIITDYETLIDTLEFRNSHLLSGLQTIQLLQEATKQSVTQEYLLSQLNGLSKLLDKAPDNNSRAELMSRCVRVALLMDNKIRHLSPYVREIKAADASGIFRTEPLKTEMLTTSYLFDISSPVKYRLEKLTQLEESAKGINIPLIQVNIKLAKALLYADSEDFAQSKLYINHVEHLLIKNGFRNDELKKAWVEMNVLRFFVFLAEELSGKLIHEKEEYQTIVHALRESAIEVKQAQSLAAAFSGVAGYLKNDSLQTAVSFEEWSELSPRENCYHIIAGYFETIATGKHSRKKLLTIEHNLTELREPFFSGVFVSCLKKFNKKG